MIELSSADKDSLEKACDSVDGGVIIPFKVVEADKKLRVQFVNYADELEIREQLDAMSIHFVTVKKEVKAS